MATPFLQRIAEVVQSSTLKPCRLATTENVSLSGNQTLDSVASNPGDRILVWRQTDPAENGIYVVYAGSWQRSSDFNGSGDLTTGSVVAVFEGTQYGNNQFQVTFSGDASFGSTEFVFSLISYDAAAVNDALTAAQAAQAASETAKTEAEAAQTAAAASAAEADADADEVATDLVTIQALSAATSAAKTEAELAADSAQLSQGLYSSTTAALGNGVQGSTSLTGGSGGTDGTFDLAMSGGTEVDPVRGYFVVSSGAVTEIVVSYPGYYSSDPTGFDFSGSSGLTGASATPVLGANVGIGEYFSVPASGDDSLILYLVTSGPAATEQLRYPSKDYVNGVREDMDTDPFPPTDFELPIGLRITSNPTTATVDATGYTIANGNRFYAIPEIEDLDLEIGDTVRVAFKRIAGTDQPASFTFRASSTLISTHNFEVLGGYYVAEAVIPATTTIIRIDFTNSSGSDVIISRPRYAKKVTQRDRSVVRRQRLEQISADPGSKSNLWPTGDPTLNSIGGGGTFADAAVNADGTILVPADMNLSIVPADNTFVRDNGSTMTILVKLSTSAVQAVRARWVGATTSTTTIDLRALGDGWYGITDDVSTSDPVGIGEIYIEVDNRIVSFSGLTPADLTVEKIIILDGAEFPDRVPSAAPDTYPDGEVIVTQASDVLKLYQRAGDGTYIEWTYTRYNDTGDRAVGWRLTGLSTATRTGDTAFTTGTAITNSGEFELAIKEVGKTDFMGGSTHGDMEEDRALVLLIDGNKVTPDGSTSYRASRVEAIQVASLWEVDNATDTLTATVVTQWIWEKQELRLKHHLEWKRSITITTPYFAMLPVLRGSSPFITETAYLAPDYASYDISTSGHAMPGGNYQRILAVGGSGIKVDLEVVSGWSTDSRSFAEDTSNRNKFYFSPYSIGGNTSVTSGDTQEFETIYRIGVSA